jgi:phage/plasmid primase-like uncharacterized protein
MDSEVEDALEYIDPNIPRDEWVRVGMALKSELGDAGLAVFDAWSQGGERYDKANLLSTWRSIASNGATRIGTLFHMAKEGGYTPSKALSEAERLRIQDERRRNAERIQQEYLKAEAEKCEAQEQVAQLAEAEWRAAPPADPNHAYLTQKAIQPHNLRQRDGNLLLPLFDADNRIWNLQTISPTGEKRFLPGSRKKGLYCPILGERPGIVICEGFATGATVAEATGYMVACAMDCGNLLPVAEMLRGKYPDTDIIIAADNDRHSKGNPGVTKARKAAEAIGARLVVPEFPDGATGTDFNDLHELLTLEEIKAIVESQDYAPVETPVEEAEGTAKTAPDLSWADEYVLSDKEAEEMSDPDWIYENLIIQGHLIVIPAPANGGKTTIMMHLAGELAADYKVYYVNADVSGGDAKQMVVEAKEKGYTLMLPDMKAGRSMDDVVSKVLDMNAVAADYSGYIFFFDTLKKMTDVISKCRAKELYKTLRGLTAKGMTIVLLAHTNKYNDADGKPIYEGTVDLRNDVDEMIYFIPKHHDDGSITVSTDPDKKRGSHVPITFHIGPDRTVTQVDDYVDVVAITQAEKQREYDATVIEAITESIKADKLRQTEIVDWCREHHGMGRRSTERVLRRYAGGSHKLWRRERAFQNNATLYYLEDA